MELETIFKKILNVFAEIGEEFWKLCRKPEVALLLILVGWAIPYLGSFIESSLVAFAYRQHKKKEIK